MGLDLTATDEELDALSPDLAIDVLALAHDYAGALAPRAPLKDVDDVLAALEQGMPGLPAASAMAREQLAEHSEQIELPDDLRSEAEAEREASGEHALPAVSVRALTYEPEFGDAPVTARHDTGAHHELTDEHSGSVSIDGVAPSAASLDQPVALDAGEAELEDLELTPEAAPLGNVPSALFELGAPANADAEQEADAAFAELFAEATRQSSMPSPRDGSVHPREAHALEDEPLDVHEDTEITDASALPFAPGLPPSPPSGAAMDHDDSAEDPFHDETLDSAEFEIVADVTESRPSNTPSARPSRPPEKRPSFLGRLFGRKEE